MVTIAYLHDGTSVYDQVFVEHLARNHKVHFLSFYAKPRFISDKAAITIMHEPLPAFITRNEWTEGIRMYALFLLRALLIKLQIRSLKPDIVIGCMATKYGFYSAIAGLRPTVLIVWGSDVVGVPRDLTRLIRNGSPLARVLRLKFVVRAIMARFALRKADAVVLDSQIQQDAAVQLGCDQAKILKFPWFDADEIRPKRPRKEMRKKLGWNENVIVFSARSHEHIYGVEHLIDAIPKVVEAEPKSRFLILGEGSLTKALKDRVNRLCVTKYVRFFGRVPRDEVVTYLNASDINVSTSFSDGTSASLLESMTLAIPSVITEIPGNKEWVTNGKNGYLVPVGDSGILAERILHLIRNQDLRHEIGNCARQTVKQNIDWRRNMEAFDNVIQKLTRTKTLEHK